MILAVDLAKRIALYIKTSNPQKRKRNFATNTAFCVKSLQSNIPIQKIWSPKTKIFYFV